MTVSTPAAPPLSSASPLRRPGFRWFFAGQTVSLLGSSMAPVALAFAVLDASGRAGDLGIVLAAHMLPLLGFLLIGGAVSDRLPRRAVLVASNLGAALTQGAVATLLLTGHYSLGAVAGLEFLNGLLTAFTSPALRGLLPELVDKDQLQRANALLGAVRNGSKVFGPSVSGLLVVATGGGVAIALDAVSYLAAAFCLVRIPAGRGPVPSATTGPRRRLAGDLREGWNTFRGTPWLWQITLAFCGVNLVQTGTWQILGPELTSRAGSAATWGLLLSVRGVGMLLMSSLLYRLTIRRFLLAGQLISALSPLPLLALGAHLAVPWVLAAGFLSGLGFSFTSISWDTSLQEHVPQRLLSRVSSYDDLFSYLAIPIGQLAVGPATSAFGPYAVATAAGLGYLFFVLLPVASRSVRQLPHPAPEPPSDVPVPAVPAPAAPVAAKNPAANPTEDPAAARAGRGSTAAE